MWKEWKTQTGRSGGLYIYISSGDEWWLPTKVSKDAFISCLSAVCYFACTVAQRFLPFTAISAKILLNPPSVFPSAAIGLTSGSEKGLTLPMHDDWNGKSLFVLQASGMRSTVQWPWRQQEICYLLLKWRWLGLPKGNMHSRLHPREFGDTSKGEAYIHACSFP